MKTRVARVELFAGAGPADQPLAIEPKTVTVFVGPNNSGKSLALRELEMALCNLGDYKPPASLVVRSAKLDIPEPGVRLAALESLGARRLANTQLSVPHASPASSTTLGPERVLTDEHFAQRLFGRVSLLRLDGTMRLSMLTDARTTDLLGAPESYLARLFNDQAMRRELSQYAFEAFGRYFVVDPTGMQVFRARLSDKPPSDEEEEQALSARARAFHAKAKALAEFSDGVRCYLGALAAGLSAQILLIDEPEAFLHPPLARKLGSHLARIAKRRGAQLVVATHSSDLLMGLLDAGVDVSTIRLTFDGESASARQLESETMQQINVDPLLRSSNVVSALFFESVVIAEGDADRAFYEEINRRLLESDGEDGAPDCLFLNAQGKAAVPKLLAPLRKFGLRTAAIVDIDVLLDGGKEWSAQLAAAQVPKVSAEGWSVIRSRIADIVTAGPDPDAQAARRRFKKQGLGVLDGDTRAACLELLMALRKHGYFIVQVGELECWFANQGVTGHGPSWLIPIFERMGFDSTNPDYMRPASDDVWDFSRHVAAWLRRHAE